MERHNAFQLDLANAVALLLDTPLDAAADADARCVHSLTMCTFGNL